MNGSEPGLLRRTLQRIGATRDEVEARDLQREVRRTGSCRLADAVDRQRVTVTGTLRHVTLRPRSGTPALEAELYDGSGAVTLIWLGRHRIAGIGPGTRLTVDGRISEQASQRVIFNPRYELVAPSGSA